MKSSIKQQFNSTMLITALVSLASFSSLTNATIVQIQTSLGNIEVNLFDETTPKTVENFLSYINDNAYDDTIVHRSISGFVSQSGGYYFDDEDTLIEVEEKPTVINEPLYSNVRGTIAMAKLGGDPNSATSQWFINLSDNSADLNSQNSGFTVFGQVTEAGMVVMDAIAALPTKNFGGAFSSTPLQGSTNASSITRDNAVVIDSIAITDNTVDSASILEPLANTSRKNQDLTSNSSAGSLGFSFVVLLAGLSIARRLK
ncbi:MAG: peptidylprolyl isomerase [Oleispira sp.]|nr:peptidylprolyl isomerase [Oleispira sp.]MBL4881253.1 peptidylprolyl isomerase [Oleispira sp.]